MHIDSLFLRNRSRRWYLLVVHFDFFSVDGGVHKFLEVEHVGIGDETCEFGDKRRCSVGTPGGTVLFDSAEDVSDD